MKKIIIGKKGYRTIFFDGTHVTFRGFYDDHKLILDKLGVYCEFYSARSGNETHIVMMFPVKGNLFEAIKELKKLKVELSLVFDSHTIIKEKYDKMVLRKI